MSWFDGIHCHEEAINTIIYRFILLPGQLVSREDSDLQVKIKNQTLVRGKFTL
jgi:hypothetical protein